MAKVEFAGDYSEAENNDSRSPLFDGVFLVIAVLASAFSGYTTYLGFSYDLPKLLSGVIAIIIGLGLLIINLRLKEDRVNGYSLVGPILAFLVFLLFSFISNTNAIYTYFLENDIVADTQNAAWRNFDAGTAGVLNAIENNDISLQGARIKEQLDIERKNLRDQITDVINPGLGEKAREHLQNIERLLGVTITRLQPPPASSSKVAYEMYADRLDELITTQFTSKFLRGDFKRVEDFKSKIQNLRSLYENSVNNKEYSSDTIDFMRRDLDSIATEAKFLIAYKGDIPIINTTADDIGSFQYTWRNFYNGINVSAIILSVLLSLMLDTLTPVLSILLYRENVEY